MVDRKELDFEGVYSFYMSRRLLSIVFMSSFALGLGVGEVRGERN